MTGTAGERHWFALRVEPGKERLAKVIFQRHRRSMVFEIATEFRPRRKSRHQKAREDIEYMLANGYIFAALWYSPDQTYNWSWVSNFHFAGKWVSLNGRPVELDRDKTEALLAYKGEAYPAYWKFLHTGKEFAKGEAVTITAGVFKDHSLVVEDIKEGEVEFLIQLLGKEQRISVPLHHVFKHNRAA